MFYEYHNVQPDAEARSAQHLCRMVGACSPAWRHREADRGRDGVQEGGARAPRVA